MILSIFFKLDASQLKFTYVSLVKNLKRLNIKDEILNSSLIAPIH